MCVRDSARPVGAPTSVSRSVHHPRYHSRTVCRGTATEFMCCVGPIRQRHDDVGVYQDHNGRSAAEAVSKQLVHPLG